MEEVDRAREKKLQVADNLNSVFWFLMDASWMLVWPLAANSFAVFTLITGILTVAFTKRTPTHLSVTAMIQCWACMNIIWMTSDLQKTPELMPWAYGCAALAFIALITAAFFGKAHQDFLEALSRLRRSRIRRPSGDSTPTSF